MTSRVLLAPLFSNVYDQFTKKILNTHKNSVKWFIYRKIKAVDFHIPLFEISLYRNTSVLNIEEMATVFHFPNNEIQTPNIIWLSARKSAAPTDLPTSGLYVGKNVFRAVERKIYMLEKK